MIICIQSEQEVFYQQPSEWGPSYQEPVRVRQYRSIKQPIKSVPFHQVSKSIPFYQTFKQVSSFQHVPKRVNSFLSNIHVSQFLSTRT